MKIILLTLLLLSMTVGVRGEEIDLSIKEQCGYSANKYWNIHTNLSKLFLPQRCNPKRIGKHNFYDTEVFNKGNFTYIHIVVGDEKFNMPYLSTTIYLYKKKLLLEYYMGDWDWPQVIYYGNKIEEWQEELKSLLTGENL